MLTTPRCILQSCSRESRLSHTCSAKHPHHGTRSRQPAADGKQHFTVLPFSGWQLGFIQGFKDVKRQELSCGAKSRHMHPLHSDQGVPSLTNRWILRHLNVIPQYFWVKPPLAPHFSAPLTELLPLYSPPPPLQEGLLHAPASTSEGSLTPKASQEHHVCQDSWCQYLPGALQSQLYMLNQATLHPFFPAIHMLWCGEGGVAKA